MSYGCQLFQSSSPKRRCTNSAPNPDTGTGLPPALHGPLDAEAQGVIVPLIENAEQAKKAVAAAKYPPKGVRGFCFSRMNNYGIDFEKYLENANDDIVVAVMIESKEAIENIDQILAVNGVDGVFIGPYDLSESYNIPGQTSDPLIKDGCKKVLDACKTAGKSAGLHVVLPTSEAIKQAIADGFNFIAIGVDTIFLNNAARQSLKIAHDAVKAD